MWLFVSVATWTKYKDNNSLRWYNFRNDVTNRKLNCAMCLYSNEPNEYWMVTAQQGNDQFN